MNRQKQFDKELKQIENLLKKDIKVKLKDYKKRIRKLECKDCRVWANAYLTEHEKLMEIWDQYIEVLKK